MISANSAPRRSSFYGCFVDKIVKMISLSKAI